MKLLDSWYFNGFSGDLPVVNPRNGYGMIRESGGRIKTKSLKMSSNMRIVKICESCQSEFVAKTTVTQCCSDSCAKRLYKVKKRNEAISRVKLETEIKRKPEVFITEDQIRVIQAKDWLTLKEAALLLNVSPLTLRRWTLAGRVKSEKMGRKHAFKRADLIKIP
jgi:excisionase family DNA binding protein